MPVLPWESGPGTSSYYWIQATPNMWTTPTGDVELNLGGPRDYAEQEVHQLLRSFTLNGIAIQPTSPIVTRVILIRRITG